MPEGTTARAAGSAGFPDGFMWGTGASSLQTEGAAPRSDWYGPGDFDGETAVTSIAVNAAPAKRAC